MSNQVSGALLAAGLSLAILAAPAHAICNRPIPPAPVRPVNPPSPIKSPGTTPQTPNSPQTRSYVPPTVASTTYNVAELYKKNEINPATGYPSTVPWAYSYEDAARESKKRNIPFIIYFCTDALAKVAGEGAEALEAYKKANSGCSPKKTPFDNPFVVAWFYAQGVELFVKVPVNAENAEIVRKYDGAPDTMLFCAPDGEKLRLLKGHDITDGHVVIFLEKEYKPKWASWKIKQAGLKDAAAFESRTERLDDARVYGFFRFSKEVFSGIRPESEAAFEALNERKIKTVISVEARPADQELARKFGMRCVHLPVPYAGIPFDKALLLAKAARDLPAPVYFSCDCGVIRAPSAATAACVLLGVMTPAEATAALKLADTPEQFAGLYESVTQATKVSGETLAALKADFPAAVEVSPLAGEMSAMLQNWQRLERARNLGWKTKDSELNPAVQPDALGLLLKLTNLKPPAQSEAQAKEFVRALKKAEAAAAEFSKATNACVAAPSADRRLEMSRGWSQLSGSCADCHGEYRDVLKPPMNAGDR